MMVPKPVAAGQAAYTATALRLYDWWVLGLSNHLIWRCPTAALRQLYDRNVSDRHVDIGVGTGYFLDKARWPIVDPSITLVDLNENSLNAAANRMDLCFSTATFSVFTERRLNSYCGTKRRELR